MAVACFQVENSPLDHLPPQGCESMSLFGVGGPCPMPFVYSMNIVVVLIFIVCILIFIESRRCAVCLVGSCSNGPPCIVHYSYIMDNV